MNWQSIESAPRDGTSILAFDGGIDIWRWRENPRVGRSWFTNTDEWDDYELETSQPTYWQPLPLPPSDEIPEKDYQGRDLGRRRIYMREYMKRRRSVSDHD